MAETGKKTYKQNIGIWGEQTAADFLVENGLRFVDRNYHTRDGEIDLIMEDGDCTVFVEVKTRTNLNFGYPEESVTDEKIEHLGDAAEKYMDMHPGINSWRMDVLSILGKPGKEKPEIEWFKNVE